MPDRHPSPPDEVVATAPVRVADIGGWTDTWFGAPGLVCHLAMGPGVSVTATRTAVRAPDHPVVLHTPDFGLHSSFGPSPEQGWLAPTPSRHPLLEHAIGTVLASTHWLTGDGLDVTVRSAVPSGASLGTSASVVVATIAAVSALVGMAERTPSDLAGAAHAVETVLTGRQAGVQDQWAAACGGIGLLRIDPYPEAQRRTVRCTDATRAALDERLVTVVFAPHDSSSVHDQVIRNLTDGGAGARTAQDALRRLRDLAGEAASALESGDLEGWGGLLTEATETQRMLHPGLVGPAHTEAIRVAATHGAVGWKVNGAGGDGGSLSVLCNDASSAERLRLLLSEHDPAWTVVRLTTAPGVEVHAVDPR